MHFLHGTVGIKLIGHDRFKPHDLAPIRTAFGRAGRPSVGDVLRDRVDADALCHTLTAEEIPGTTSKGIAAASQEFGLPIAFGVLTTDTVEQAINRAGGKQGNSGYSAAVAAIEMANLLRALDVD